MKGIEPVAWQWLNTAQFRKKIPAGSDSRDWNALYPQSVIDALMDDSPRYALTDAGRALLEGR